MAGDIIRDAKYAIRSFARRPLFTAVIVLTLALGIGSNVAMFSVVNAVLVRALPYDHPEELALVWTRLQATNVERSLVSGPDFGDYQTQTTRFEGFAGAVAVPVALVILHCSPPSPFGLRRDSLRVLSVRVARRQERA